MATVMRALGIPTRIVFCIPPIDGNDRAQHDMFLNAIHHHGVRATLHHGLPMSEHGFTNHLFNEVFVGNRWVRLNYDRLGQDNLNANYFGLLTHVFTTDSLSHVPMPETWGRRIALYPNVEPKLSSINPYRLLKVSDHFGKFANVANPEAPDDELRKVTINSAFWIDAPPRDLEGKLTKGARNTDFFVGIAEYIPQFPLQLHEFLERASHKFVLEAPGRPLIHATANGWNITMPSGKDIYQLIALRIDPEDRGQMTAGAAYQIRPVSDNQTYFWTVKDDIALQGKSR
jgi:hypothetical protein